MEDCCPAICIESDDGNTPMDTVRVIYYLDGKQVPFSIIREKRQRGELAGGLGAGDHKKAIQMYGEKFRYGVVFIDSKEKPDNLFQLNGKIDTRYDGNRIMLFTFQQDTIFSVDTTTIKNGAFCFQGQEYLADFSMVTTGNYPDKVIASEVILNRGVIYMELDSINKVWGGTLNDKLFAFRDSMQTLSKQWMSLAKDSSQTENTKIIYDRIKEYVYNFAIENRDNLLGMRTFTDGIGHYYHDIRFDKLCDIFDKERTSDIVKNYLRFWTKQEQRIQDIGKKYEDFEFQTPEGIVKKLSDYVEKSEYIYLDFWASWCGPCIADIPNLKEIYEKYKDLGFEIIGISLDTNKESWLKALNRLDAPWIHLCDFEGSQSKVTEAYNIKGIPIGILLDKQGVIIETNLRGSSFLDKRMQELLDESQK